MRYASAPEPAAAAAAPRPAASAVARATRRARPRADRSGDDERIALATDGADHAVAQFAADAADDDVEARAGARVGVAPRGLEQLRSRHQPSVAPHEDVDHRPLARGQ